jgi:2,5-diketo-D-gluconate reductase B
MQTMITAHGLRMPKLGFGTYRMKGAECQDAVERALGLGYRHIDDAEMYDNEEAVGAAIKASGVPRGDIHLTTKVTWSHLAPAEMQKAMETSLGKLQTDYVDLYLIHWPAKDMDLPASLEMLMRLQEQGFTRKIGVCNFPVALLKRTVEEVGAPIVCNQVEYHVLLSQAKLMEYMKSKDLVLIAYCPLAQGRLGDHPELTRIAQKHGVTPGQVALRWLLDQPDVAAIPKAQRVETQTANFAAATLDLHLDDSDLAAIAALPKDQRFVSPPFAPEWDK